MEKLTRYMEGRTQREVAASFGISDAFLSQILNRRRAPGYKLMLRIEEATGGEVDVHSWRDFEVVKRREAAE